jgi:hypothetical protein
VSAGAFLRLCVLLLLALRWCWEVWLCCVILLPVSVLLTGLLGALYADDRGLYSTSLSGTLPESIGQLTGLSVM